MSCRHWLTNTFKKIVGREGEKNIQGLLQKSCLLFSYAGSCSCWGKCWRYSSRGWTFPPRFCYILLLCDKWQQRGCLTEWHLTWKCKWSKRVAPRRRSDTHGHSLMLAEHFWRPSSGCEHREVVGAAFQQRWQWVTSTGADFYEHGMQALVRSRWNCTATGGEYAEKECFVAANFLSQMQLLCSLYLL